MCIYEGGFPLGRITGTYTRNETNHEKAKIKTNRKQGRTQQGSTLKPTNMCLGYEYSLKHCHAIFCSILTLYFLADSRVCTLYHCQPTPRDNRTRERKLDTREWETKAQRRHLQYSRVHNIRTGRHYECKAHEVEGILHERNRTS